MADHIVFRIKLAKMIGFCSSFFLICMKFRVESIFLIVNVIWAKFKNYIFSIFVFVLNFFFFREMVNFRAFKMIFFFKYLDFTRTFQKCVWNQPYYTLPAENWKKWIFLHPVRQYCNENETRKIFLLILRFYRCSCGLLGPKFWKKAHEQLYFNKAKLIYFFSKTSSSCFFRPVSEVPYFWT